MNPLTDSGLSRLQFFAKTCKAFPMFLIVESAFPVFLSSHKTLSILPLGSAFGCRGLACWT